MFHRDTNVAKFLPLDALLALSSQDDAFNMLLCLVSMVSERILASVTSVATINLLRFFFFLRYLMAVPTQIDLLISVQMHLIFGFLSFI